MRNLATQAELVKLARILQTETGELEHLDYLEAERLRTLREGITEALFEKFRPTFTGFARLSSIVPLAMSARIAERVLGPLLAGRIAGEMPPDKAIDMAGRLSDDFLADTCLHIDPVRAKPIIAGFPVDRAIAITRVLLARGETITMSRFVDVLPEHTLFAATDAIENESDLLEIGFFVENSAQLDRVIEHLNSDRREAIVAAAASEQLWPEVLATLLRIGQDARLAMAELAMAQDAAILDSLIRAAAQDDLWPALLQIADEMPSSVIGTLAREPAFADAGVIRSVIDSVIANDLWARFRNQTPAMGAERLARVLEVAANERKPFLWELDRRLKADDADRAALAEAVERLSGETRQRAQAACDKGLLADTLAAAGSSNPGSSR
ncbi:hypothetical protein [Salinisphaera sp.]|uniref:hypothetical protein n=1 Tax=Salinisphaera sp. TaxID=1914330 RepID=UPI000C410D5C|nr:hypothetical protein [Salinisphaera sp.]MBS64219.1 hypothetical protein [Salinisphaera sp.]